MKKFKYTIGIVLSLFLIVVSCVEDTYEFGDLKVPKDLVINVNIIGKTTALPFGDGSGEVIITLTAKDVITYQIGFSKIEDFGNVTYMSLPSGIIKKKFTDPGENTYRISVIAFGAGGVSTSLTKDIKVRSDYKPAPEIVTALIGNSSKAWIVDKSKQGHFGVGPISAATPVWWQAGVDEKVGCCPCFYTAKFIFANGTVAGTYKLTVESPDGIFTKTGDLAGGLPGIPATGAEGCYPFDGGTSSFNFVPSSSTVVAESASTKASILLSGVNTFIGYGATLKEYEIVEITPTYMYLRVQGTETGNAWYIKMIPAN